MPTPIVLLLTIAASALPGADLSGKWVGTIELEKTRPLSLFLHQKGQSIEGGVAIDAESMRFPVQNGELRENTVTLTTIYGGWPLRFRLKVGRGKLVGYADYSSHVAKV